MVARLPFICVTDSKWLFDAVKKDTNPAAQCEDKRTSIVVDQAGDPGPERRHEVG